MIDFLKAKTENQTYINRLFSYAENYLKPHRPQNNNYVCFSNGSGRFRLEFRKIIYKGKLAGFYNLEICFSPHYLFNNDLHNGNDFAPLECIKTIRETFLKIGIEESELIDFKVVNLEYALNLITGLLIELIVNGILYTKKTSFIIPNPAHQYFKISFSTNYKEIKAYAKGLQFANFPHYGIDINTFRFEVRTKQSKNIKKLGINTIADLLNIEVYNALFQSLNNEWENVLIINLELTNKENTPKFWSDILEQKYRNKFSKTKLKYYENLALKNDLHHLIKCKIIDKITALQKGANSTEKTAIHKGKLPNEKSLSNRINLEYAPFREKDEVNSRLCKVTGLDISMQKKSSKYLCSTGLKCYKENDPETFGKLCLKFLTDKTRGLSLEKQIYHIGHNIRNTKTNPQNNRKRFDRHHYHPSQKQFQFTYN
ncbi:hypothetical protein [Halpernia frigidisoli]|uniref:Uncharacterized protein n=1 Tax=Halpernia frigidisoli TaxID=1125876 RepID=A0A1I3FTY2_9FLAO|nr:hypothetical protein [Halpernia frigidisoli]SFI14635.1 hypothetical protein SAMN05443292_1627 [Halpernia frigidisoli]